MGFLDPSSWASAFDSSGSDAAAAQALLAMQSLKLQKQQYANAQAQMAPWVQSGQTNLGMLNALMQPGGQLDPTKRFSMTDFQADPGYAWRQQQGAKAIMAAGAAGLPGAPAYGSGNMAVALQNMGQNLASQEYDNAYNRWAGQRGTEFNMLAGLANPNAAQQLSGMGMNFANSGSNILAGMGNALGQGIMNNYAIRNAGMSNLGNSLQSGLGNWLMADSGWEWNDGSGNLNNAQNLWNTIAGWFGGGYGYE